jgi:hypothetical protein
VRCRERNEEKDTCGCDGSTAAFHVLQSSVGRGSGSTDKEFYSFGEIVKISVEGLTGGLSPYVGELSIWEVTDGGWMVRSWPFPEGMDVTFDWSQSGNVTDPANGPFCQVEPGFYEIWWSPCGTHSYDILCRFLICAAYDLNADGTVNILDITLAVSAYGSRVGEPRWISGADMAPHYGIIDIFDLVTIASHYGESW